MLRLCGEIGNVWRSPGMMTVRVVLVLALTWPSAMLPAQAGSRTMDDAIRRVDDHYNHLSSLEAHYTEHYAGLGMDRTETGTLLLKKPGRMRWSYATPAGKVFILDGKNGWFYTPGDAQAQRVSARQLDDMRSPLQFLLGHTQLKKELDNVAVRATADGFAISGIPKGMNQRIQLLTLEVDVKGVIRSMKIAESDGATTGFTFSDQRENVAVRSEDFRFTAPPGVAVVDGLPPM